jgi:hypothetical protein
LLRTDCSLKSLGLYANNITSAGATSLGKSLKNKLCALEKLELRVNNIQDDGMIELANSTLEPHTKLWYLDVESNALTDRCTSSISASLASKQSRLKRLMLSNNNIGDQGIRTLVKGLLSEHSTLTYLDLNRNNIGEQGIFELSKPFSRSNTHRSSALKHLFVYSNPFSETKEGILNAAVSMMGNISTRGINTVLKDLGGINLSLGTTFPLFRNQVNKDILNMIRKGVLARLQNDASAATAAVETNAKVNKIEDGQEKKDEKK